MYNGAKIIVGLIIGVALLTFPIWYQMGKASPAPELEMPKDQKECVASVSYMRTAHMKLLDDWRHSVVRDENRVHTSESGKTFDMSLTNTCLECHTNKDKFCDKCHDYAKVSPYCWDCHVVPEKEG